MNISNNRVSYIVRDLTQHVCVCVEHSLALPQGVRWCGGGMLGCCSVAKPHPTLQPHGLQHTKLPCPSLSPRVSNSCPLSRWCHPTISSSTTFFSFCLQSFPASGSFPMSQLFASGGQSTGASASASVLPIKRTVTRWEEGVKEVINK